MAMNYDADSGIPLIQQLKVFNKATRIESVYLNH